MGLIEIIIVAISLSMDAFAVSVTLGLSVKRPRLREFLAPGVYFGFFQMLMPLVGYVAGTTFAGSIQHIDHWIAFALLVAIGGKMIWESFSKEEKRVSDHPFRFTKMLLLAIATSIDALAVGVTFSFFEVNIPMAILIIGFATFLLSIAGVKIGNSFGAKYTSKAELLGGSVLVLLGVKILVEHLFL